MPSGERRPRANSVFVWQWGRHGAGPRLAVELAAALQAHTELKPLLSLSDRAELLASADPAIWERIPIAFEAPSYLRRTELPVLLLRMSRTLARLSAFLATTQPAAAICVMPGYFDLFVARTLDRLSIPLITVVHDAAAHPGDPYRMLLRLQPALVRKSRAVVTLSQHVASTLSTQGLLHGRAHDVIPHPALSFPDLALAAPLPPSYPGGRPLAVLMAGRLQAYKGLAVFLDALTALQGQPVTARIVGRGGDGSLLQRARSLANCTVDNRWLSEAELIDEIDRSDLVVTPYVEASQSGIIALAVARGRPVVTTPVGGLVEQVRHEASGLIAEQATGDALARCIARLVAEPDLYRSCAEGARRLALHELCWAQLAPAYARLVSKAAQLASDQGSSSSRA